MPGNEVGDRIQNFFQQGNFSDGQHHLQTVEGSWPVSNNNNCFGNERQIHRTFNSKNSNTQQSDIERGQGNQFSQGSYGLSIAQSNWRPDFGKIQSQNQQLIFNGFMHAPTVAHARQNEANLLGVHSQPDRQNLTSRGLSVHEAQQSGGPQRSSTSSACFGTAESPVNFDFLGSQQQMSGEQPGMLQSLSRQQSGISDAQLLQQQIMLKQMHELRRQQQLQQLGALHRNPLNHIPDLPSQVAGNYSSAHVNGSPMHDAPNHPWSSQLMMGNANWLQHGVSQSVQGHSNGLMRTPDEGQTVHLMGLVPQQPSQSFYGVPVSNARASSPFLHNPMDKPSTHQLQVRNTLSGTQHAAFPEQVNMRDVIVSDRSALEVKSSFPHVPGQSPSNVVSMENVSHIQRRNALPTELDGRQDVARSSESSVPDKPVEMAASSQASVSLDPTEEKILFGSDDNIWEAFGGSLTTSTDNHLDGAFPSMQSGSWSALMQSAVAESSSGDMGQQGDWRGLGVQSSDSLTGTQQFLVHPDSGKPHSSFVNGMTSPSSRPFAHDPSLSENFRSTGFQQSVFQSMQSSQTGCGQQNSAEGSKWQHHTKPGGDGSQVPQNVYTSAECKTVPGSWSHQPSISSHVSQPCNRPSSLYREGNMNRDQTAVLSSLGSMPGLNIDLKDSGSLHSSSSIRVSHEHGQKRSGDHGVDFWRNVGSMKSRVDVPVKFFQHHNKGPQILESSANCSEKFEFHEADNGDKKENSSDSHGSTFSHHASAGGLRENVWMDAGDSRKISGGKQMSSGSLGWKTAGQPRKFQYHPMGDVNMDGEHSYGVKQSMQSQAAAQNIERPLQSSQNMLELLQKVDHSKEQSTPLHYSSNDRNRSSVLPEAEASDGTAVTGQKQASASQGFGLQLAPPSQGIQDTNVVMASQGPSQAVGSASPSQISFMKGEKSCAWLAPVSSAHSSPSMHSTQPGESRNSRAAVIAQPNIDSSQGNMLGNISTSFATGSQYVGALLQNQHKAESGARLTNHQLGHTSFDSLTTHGKQIDDTNDRTRTSHSPQIVSASAADFASQRETSQLAAMDKPGGKVSAFPQNMSGFIQKINLPSAQPNAWGSIYSLQDSSGSQYQPVSNLLKLPLKPNEETDSCPPQKQDDLGSLRKGKLVSSGDLNATEQQQHGELDPAQKMGVMPQGKETLVAELSSPSSSNSAATQKDIEAFGRSLKPNNLHDNYSLLHQVQTMKSMVMDPSNRDMKRFKGPDSDPENGGKSGQHFSGGSNSMIINASLSHAPVPSRDANIQTFLPETSQERNAASSLQHAKVTSQGLFSVARNDTQTFGGSSLSGKVEPSQISPQMVPTWFDQQGTLKNGQLATTYDMRRTNVPRAEQQLIMGKYSKNLITDNSMEQGNAITDNDKTTHVSQSASTYIPAQQPSPHQAVATGITTQPVVSLIPQKRKSAAWHKEVSLGSQKLQNISCAEADWARSTNHLLEKVEDEADVIEDVAQVARSKRRLILTTQLMQQVFRPPPHTILSLDASSSYETVTYFLGRLALGDACSQLCYLESMSLERLDKGNLSLEKHKISGRISDQYFGKVVEGFIDRARTLESDILRLDKRASILDLRLECQELERFSVINRFAKFLGRGQVDGADTSSASSTSWTAQKPLPQQCVAVFPVPENLPESVHCLSL